MSDIERIRSFNRTVTSHVGALNGSDFLGRHRSLAASRVLFEIGPGGVEIRELRDRLDLDSGYASRLLRGLEREKLVRVARAPSDTRARMITLTPAGRRELAVLNRLSDRFAGHMVQSLSERQRATLVEAMGTVERLLLAGSVKVQLVSATSRTAQYCLAQYFRELNERFEGGFQKANSPIGAEEMTAPRGCFVVAMLHGQPVGCGGLIYHGGWGYLKRMWVAPSSRGMGLGKRLLVRLEELARARGFSHVRLETNKALTEAIQLYRTHGYREIQPFNDEHYAHHWFEKRL